MLHATHHSPHSILLTDYSSFSTPQLLALALHHLPPCCNPRIFFPNQTRFPSPAFLTDWLLQATLSSSLTNQMMGPSFAPLQRENLIQASSIKTGRNC